MSTVTIVPESALLDGPDRLVVSPAHGKLAIPVPVTFTTEGEVVRAGEVIARVDGDGAVVDVCAPCNAWVISYLLRDGERVEPGTAIAHVRAL